MKRKPNAPKEAKMILVSSTHWDREWYLTFQQFRRRLVMLVDELLELLETKPSFHSFTLDGQTIVVEDYLEIRPENRERLEQQVRRRKVLVGPWYVLPDEFLVSGEALVRNLLLGGAIAKRLGRSMQVGYVPDPFGHIAQLPQILAGFRLNNAIFMRGMDDRADCLATEFWWEALDGSAVLAVHQVNTYGNACHLGIEAGRVNMEKALAQIERELEQLGPKASTELILLNNGIDHAFAQPEIPEIIDFVNARLEGAKVVHGTLEDYVEGVLARRPELERVKGELHGGRHWEVLSGVYSARIYLKQENERIQTLLEKWAEPFSALAWLEGGKYESSFLWQAWKFCLQNHPHDSICGCSIDEVHREMLPRFAQAQQIGEMLTQESLAYLANRIDTRSGRGEGAQAAVVWNPHGWEWNGPVQVRLERRLREGEEVPQYSLLDPAGQAVAVQLRRREQRQHLSTGGSAEMRVDSAELCWLAQEVPALGYRTYQIVEGAPESLPSDLSAGANWLENSLVRLTLNSNGTFDLLDKKSGRFFSGLHLLEDSEDAGDEYNYSRAENGAAFTSQGVACRMSLLEAGPVAATFRLEWEMQIPAALEQSRLSRSTEMVPCSISSEVTLWVGCPRVDIRTKVNNRACDHRLRVLFPTGLKAETCHADTAFGVVERSLQLPRAENWREKPAPTHAQQRFVAVDDGEMGLCVMNLGLPEYEVRKEGERATICLTLLRSVGWLSRDDGEARAWNAGPMLPTPEAQCLGEHEFHYALLAYGGDWRRAEVWKWAQEFAAPPRPVVTGEHEGQLPKEFGYLSLSPHALILSALKKAEKRDALVVRAYNTTPLSVEGEFRFGRSPLSARLLGLDEEPLEGEAAQLEAQTVKVPFRGFQIRTLEVTFRR